jgi:hypothetical protein
VLQNHFVDHKSHADCCRIDLCLNDEKLVTKCLSWHSLELSSSSCIHIFGHREEASSKGFSDSSNVSVGITGFLDVHH